MIRFRRHRLPTSIQLPPWWRRHGARLMLLSVALIGVVCARSLPPASAPAKVSEGDWGRYHDRSFQVVRIIDGDTLDIAVPDRDKPTTRIRLWGVDSPEIAHGKEPSMHFGPEATRFAEQSLSGRRVHIVLSPKQSRDRYGRLLAYVFLERGGIMFNERLIEEGFAYADRRFDHHYEDRFEALENEAHRRGRGLWKDLIPADMPSWRQRYEERMRRTED